MTQALFDEWDQPQGELKPLIEVKPPPKYENPMMATYGKGPDGKQCKDCAQLAGICYAKTVYKCRLRLNTHTAKTDHKLHWYACGKFEERTKDIPLYDGRGNGR
jgi:hypothetical protein